MIERITFLLAVVGYAGLAATAVRASLSTLPFGLWRTVAAVIVTHVALVWAARYEWSLAAATRNGYAGFVIFHGALALIVTSVFLVERRARALVITAFAIVSAGALGAVFRYEVVAIYRVPVIGIALAGAAGLAHAYRLRRRGARSA